METIALPLLAAETSSTPARGQFLLTITLATAAVAALLLFWIYCQRHGRYRDAEVESRGSSVLLGNWLRSFFAWTMQPVMRALVAARVTPFMVTITSVLLAIAGGACAATGWFTVAGCLYLAAGACDFLDGRLARATGQVSPAGAALDSVLDRYSESAILIGLAWFYRDSWVLLPVLLLLAGSFLVPYVRARGESLGVTTYVGLWQRPERVVLLGLALTLAPALTALVGPSESLPRYLLVAGVLCLLAVSTHGTALRRLRHVATCLSERQADEGPRGDERSGP